MTQEAVQETPPPAPGPVVTLLKQALPGVDFAINETPTDESVTVQRDDFLRVMETVRNGSRLQFDYLRCQSGVDYLNELESVYHLYSFTHKHSLAVKVRCPYEDPHVPTVSHIWDAANWHERETHEMFGIVYDGHPDLRPLLTEEGLGYYILRKSHPLAEIEEWQEDLLIAVDRAKQQMAAQAGEEVPAMSKVEMAQAKAKIMKEARDKARAEGLDTAAEKAAVRAAIDKFEAEMAAGGGGGAAPAGQMSKVEIAQAKSKLITKARADARAQGMDTKAEKEYVAQKLKEFTAELEGGSGDAAPATPAKPQMSKIELAQAKSKLITKARAEARAQGMDTAAEKEYVAKKLKEFSAEQGG